MGETLNKKLNVLVILASFKVFKDQIDDTVVSCYSVQDINDVTVSGQFLNCKQCLVKKQNKTKQLLLSKV